jgi:hypothetical protein
MLPRSCASPSALTYKSNTPEYNLLHHADDEGISPILVHFYKSYNDSMMKLIDFYGPHFRVPLLQIRNNASRQPKQGRTWREWGPLSALRAAFAGMKSSASTGRGLRRATYRVNADPPLCVGGPTMGSCSSTSMPARRILRVNPSNKILFNAFALKKMRRLAFFLF